MKTEALHTATEAALALIQAERDRQMTREGFSADHDDAHVHEELARAAATYAMPASLRTGNRSRPLIPWTWPWGFAWWKPSPEDRPRELVKAGALIVAELERVLRQAAR